MRKHEGPKTGSGCGVWDLFLAAARIGMSPSIHESYNPTSHHPTHYSIFLTAGAKQALIQCVFAACECEGNVDSMTPSKKYARRAE